MDRRVALCSMLAALLLSSNAGAQLFRTYVASDGNDANPCTLAQPCRLLPAALAAVASGGEIWMLDSANYNTATVNVNKSVTILAVPGAVGSVVATGGNAITINAAGVHVGLRNLVIAPLPGGGGLNGVTMIAGDKLTVEGCLIARLAGGIAVIAPAAVRVVDTIIRDGSGHGLFVAGGARAVVSKTTIMGNTGNGISVNAEPGVTTTADIVDSVLHRNNYGLTVLATSPGVVYASVHNSQVTANINTGLSADGTATLSVSNSVITSDLAAGGKGIAVVGVGTKVLASGNTVSGFNYGLHNSGGLFETAGNNAVRNNTFNTSGTITVVAAE